MTAPAQLPAAPLPNSWERLVPEQLANDKASRRVYALHRRRYEAAARYVKDKRVLDIACGVGYGTRMLHEAGAASVVGVDLSEQAIDYARAHYAADGIKFVTADAQTFAWPQTFDVIVSFETIEHLPEPAAFLQNLRHLVSPDGWLLLSAPLGETRHLDPYHLQVFDEQSITNLVSQAGFDIQDQRRDELFFRRKDLLRWRRLYPNAPQTTLRELVLTRAGWQVAFDCLFRGGVDFPSLVVMARPRA